MGDIGGSGRRYVLAGMNSIGKRGLPHPGRNNTFVIFQVACSGSNVTQRETGVTRSGDVTSSLPFLAADTEIAVDNNT